MTYLDAFSGYGGFHLGFEQAGWKFDKCYYSEIDKHAIANYSYNFPNSIYAGSIETICNGGIVTELDLFTFGWPCQDNSIAGKRKGQRDGTRSGLLYEAAKVINRFKPRNFVAENVLGLLSVNEAIDIVESLKVLTYLNESCPQYDIEMQLLNTRWFLPQNRERLYFVGHRRGSGSGQIFPIGEGSYPTNEEQLSRTCGTSRISAFNLTMPEITRRNVKDSHSIRDLTPVEYERLQGLPENWTKYEIINGKVKELTDAQRYKLCGNGVSIPVVKTIAEKLKY